MHQYFPLAAITDEFSPDLETAIRSMSELGMTGAELRMLFGKNIIDLTDDEIEQAKQMIADRGMKIVSLASPLLKCVLPDAPPVDRRFEQDSFNAKHTIADQPRLAKRAFELAGRTGARIIRVFSYWRTTDPEQCFDRIVEALGQLAEQAAAHDVTIGIENEHACNVATAAETARVLKAVSHPNLKVVWDPANARVAGENPFPDGYRMLPPNRIAHVHAKDVRVEGNTVHWLELGAGTLDWQGQVQALVKDGYHGYISLETHWPGPGNDKHEASIICGRNLMSLVAAA